MPRRPVSATSSRVCSAVLPIATHGLVDAVLESPQPPRAASEDGECLSDLRKLQVLAPHRGSGRVRTTGSPTQRLALERRPVAVLREDRMLGGRSGDRDDDVATHGHII
jgi:hypothetical protein